MSHLEDVQAEISELRDEVQSAFNEVLDALGLADSCETGKDCKANLKEARDQAQNIVDKIQEFLKENYT